MLKRVKQLFCDHFFITYAQHEPFYISTGDEHHDRRSMHCIHICHKCNKRIDSVSKWNNDAVITGMLAKSNSKENDK